MKKFIFSSLKYAAAAAAICVGMASCDDTDDLEARVDSLESRVTALETQVSQINSNVEAISALLDASTIYSVSVVEDGVWELVLSTGETLTLYEGAAEDGNTPIMSVDADGYWMVDYGDGAEYIYYKGSKVKATGSDGITPIIGVDDNGYWIVSYDGGTTYEQILDPTGNPINAVAETSDPDPSDEFFTSVSYDEDAMTFTVVLTNGTTITLPVVPSFMCSISGADETQVFSPGETKTYEVTMEGVAQAILSAPDGWSASLTDTELTITAPDASTKVSANTDTDVTILALSSNGYATAAKVVVELGDDTPSPTVAPTAVITTGKATASTITFTVTLTDVTSWIYLVSTDTALTADDVTTSGTTIDGADETTLTEENLEASTTYMIYVVPVNDATVGDLVSAEMTTSAEASTSTNDYYQAYCDGEDITINGTVYNLATNGTATLLEASEASTALSSGISSGGVFFLDETADGASFCTSGVTQINGDLVLIGRYADSPVTISAKNHFLPSTVKFVSKNIIWDMNGSSFGNNSLVNNNRGPKYISAIHFDDCSFVNVTKPFFYGPNTSSPINSIRIENCSIQILGAEVTLFNFANTTELASVTEFVFDNNVVYDASCHAFHIDAYNNATQTGTSWTLEASICNNIFYNCPSTNGYFRVYQVAGLTMEKNVFWASTSYSTGSRCITFYSTDQTGDGLSYTDNLYYGLADDAHWQYFYADVSSYVPEGEGANYPTKLDSDPFTSFDTSTGEYELTTKYSGYGPQE